MGYWSSFFTGMTWSGGSYGSGDLSDNDAAPEDIILHQVWWTLYQDSVLSNIFVPNDRIEAMEIRNALEFRNLPRLQVYLGSLQEDQTPTQLDVNQIGVYVGVRQALESGVPRLDAGESSSAGVMRRIKTALKQNKSLVTMVNGQQVQLSSLMLQDGGLNYLVDEDIASNRWAMTTEVLFTYQVDVDFNSGRIKNIKAAMGN